MPREFPTTVSASPHLSLLICRVLFLAVDSTILRLRVHFKGWNLVTVFDAVSTAVLENGNIAGEPEFHNSNWSRKCGDLVSPLWPRGMTKRVASQLPWLEMWRMETRGPTFGVWPEPWTPLGSTRYWPPMSGASESGWMKRARKTFSHFQFDSSGPRRLGAARPARETTSQALIR